MSKLTFKPKQIAKQLLGTLKDRSFDVVASRFGLTTDAEKKTLEAIGKKYGITRERVRQIENASLNSIRKSDEFKELQHIFDELEQVVKELGTVVSEDHLLDHISDDESTKNHVHFFLVLGDQFSRHKENEHFKSRWTTNEKLLSNIHDALHDLYAGLNDDELMSESQIIEKFLESVKDISNEHRDEEIAKRWIAISKKVAANPLNEWGKSDSKNVKTRGVKDYAFLVLRKHGTPMHFREVAEAITDTFGKKTHPATTHNELIKDPRFVLVGRGMYGLKAWGYKAGVVKDVIADILNSHGPLSKDEVVDYVMKERFLKRNTILVNLQNPKYFKKQEDGRYTTA